MTWQHVRVKFFEDASFVVAQAVECVLDLTLPPAKGEKAERQWTFVVVRTLRIHHTHRAHMINVCCVSGP